MHFYFYADIVAHIVLVCIFDALMVQINTKDIHKLKLVNPDQASEPCFFRGFLIYNKMSKKLIGVKFVPEENAYQAKVYERHIGYFETEVLAAFKHDEAVYGLLGSQNVRQMSDNERSEILNFTTHKYQDLMQILIFQKKKFMELKLSDVFPDLQVSE